MKAIEIKYMSTSELIEQGDFTFVGQTGADAEGWYESEWLLTDGTKVRVKQNLRRYRRKRNKVYSILT